MILFFKHLVQSIKRKPLQPFILILTLTLSVFMIVSSLSVKTMLQRESELSRAAKYGRTDLTVSLSGNSKSRFMFKKDVQRLLGDKVSAVGTYEIVFLPSESETPVFAVASDLGDIGEIFDLSFSEYGRITESTVSSSMLITEDFAERNGLHLGDAVTVGLFSEEITYTVQGISPLPYLGKYDVLVDIRSAMDALASDSVIAAALGDGFNPSSTLCIDVKEPLTVTECIDTLRLTPEFAEKSFTDIEAQTKSQSNVKNLSVSIDISILLVCVLAMSATFCCFYILADERCEENLSFSIAGARPFLLNIIQYAEVFLYWIFGTALGIALSFIMIEPIRRFVGLKYALSEISASSLLIAPTTVLFASIVTVTLFIAISNKKRTRRRDAIVPIAVLTALAIILMVLVFIAPARVRSVLGIILTVLLLLLSFILVPIGIKRFLGLINGKIDKAAIKSQKLPKSLRYAVKNLCSVRPLHNVSRLISVFISVISVAFVIVSSTHNYIKLANGIFSHEYVVLGATERCAERIAECDEVSTVSGVYFSTAIVKNKVSSLIISVEDAGSLNSELGIKELPSDNGAFVSKSVAESADLSVGDMLSIVCNGNDINLEIRKIQSSPMPYVCFSFKDTGVSPNMIIPIFGDGISPSDGVSAVSAVIANDVAVIGSANGLMNEKTRSLGVYLSCGDILWVMVILFSAIGIIDCVYNNYRARREEFWLFGVSGMSKKELIKLKVFEVLTALIFGCITGFLCSMLVIPFINKSMRTFGIEIIELFLAKV